MHNIYINQLGYTPDNDKYFLTLENVKEFKILKNSKVKYKGFVKLRKNYDKSTGETVYIGSFNNLKEEGEYIVELDSGSKSYPFKIDSKIYNRLLKTTLKSYYFQRCGTPLLDAFAGEFKRGICHCNEVEYHRSTGLKGTKDVSGGWHDAGDYGRYITPGAVSLSSMLTGYEMFPEKFEFNDIGLPENKNYSDFYKEMRYELDWMFKMQELDKSNKMYGALHYMINSSDYCWAEPHKDEQKYYIMDYCSIATADFAAIMACASRLFKNIDQEFAELALKRALLAWDFISNNPPYPKDGFLRPDDIHTGGYAEDRRNNIFNDNSKLWPAVELFLTTGDEIYHTIVKTLFGKKESRSGGMSWQDKNGFAEIKYIISDNGNIDKKLKDDLIKRLLKRCNYFLDNYNETAFKTVINDNEYYWGSNSEIFSRSIQLLAYYQISKDKKYIDASLAQLNYILGLNINNISFISGLGSNFTNNIHNASFDNDGIKNNFPGMMPGGPNKSVESVNELFDKALFKECPPGTAPAKCYIDHVDSFSSNENCITYTAPLISVAAFFSN